MRVSSADFISRFDDLSHCAASEPVTITTGGLDRLVLVSADEYARLTRRDRRAITPQDLTDEELELIAGAEVPEEFAHLDRELES